jgi:hypothetical protein
MSPDGEIRTVAVLSVGATFWMVPAELKRSRSMQVSRCP